MHSGTYMENWPERFRTFRVSLALYVRLGPLAPNV